MAGITLVPVTPAKAGVQLCNPFVARLDPGFRRGDENDLPHVNARAGMMGSF